MAAYRSWADRRLILRAILAEGTADLSGFALDPREEATFRADAARLLDRFARRRSSFKGTYELPVARPFRNVVYASLAVIATTVVAVTMIYHAAKPGTDETSLFTGAGAAVVAAIGWTIAGWLSHRNTLRQNTSNLLFARFSQANFADAVHRFHRQFGFDAAQPVTVDELDALRATGSEDDWRTATAATFLLNYFEFVAHGVLRGDLDPDIVRESFRGIICFYHDKCRPVVRRFNQADPHNFASLIALRLHYLEP